jgi:hypothetical protein
VGIEIADHPAAAVEEHDHREWAVACGGVHPGTNRGIADRDTDVFNVGDLDQVATKHCEHLYTGASFFDGLLPDRRRAYSRHPIEHHLNIRT